MYKYTNPKERLIIISLYILWQKKVKKNNKNGQETQNFIYILANNIFIIWQLDIFLIQNVGVGLSYRQANFLETIVLELFGTRKYIKCYY